MPEIYYVANVEAAVDLAYKFKEEGKYQWFRGQVLDYVPHSSLYRRQLAQNIDEANFKYQVFIQWVGKIEELKYLLEPNNTHELEAIMQHYGIPTHYIDFTTDPGVAGFFAADTDSPPTDGNSCIYCLNTEDLFSVWDTIKTFDFRKDCQLEKVTIEVNNLWRLQAQYGVFLLCNYNLEVDYPLDKISFPYAGYPSYPTKDVIYPHHKSSLEMLLDQYFDQLKTATMHRDLKDVANFIPWEEFPDGYYVQAFKDPSKIKELESWKRSQEGWRHYKAENFHVTTGITQTLRLNNLSDAQELSSVIKFGVKQLLRSNPSIRARTIDWHFEESPKDLNLDKVSEILGTIWNGMRTLPFSYDEISEACGNTLLLYLKSNGFTPDRNIQMEIFSNIFGKSMRVGFANEDSTGSYGYASYSSILNATEINIPELVIDQYRELTLDTRERFKIIYNPRLMFEFNKFKSFFASEIIPSQVAWDQSLVIYNPHKLVTFGIP